MGASSSSDVGMWSNKAFSILIALIIDNSGHRKSGNLTAGVGRQYMGEIGKTDNGIITVTAHLYDGQDLRIASICGVFLIKIF